ncbi:MAG: GNAT family N-acetyltransferase [Acetobacteraceae bacterium]|nr:GNAT family N-acetyltransferase [Acetobacteraceae bacterium]
MTDAPFVIAGLSGGHDQASFSCGVEPLDRYFRQQASQDIRRRVANCFVMTEAATDLVAGYYTLAAANVRLTELPAATTAKLPRYPSIPAALLGRLAVSSSFQARKLGSVLLTDAIARTARADVGAFAVLVDPKDDAARSFYARHAFMEFPPPERRMFIPIEAAPRIFQSRRN